MKKQFLKFGNYRIRLDSIVRYSPKDGDKATYYCRYGICFLTRDGDTFTISGDDYKARDEALKFLDSMFAPKEFIIWKCENCANNAAGCDDECSEIDGFPKFERKSHDT